MLDAQRRRASVRHSEEECGFDAAARLDDVVRDLDVVAVEECAVNAFPD
jgi:hypothetical protein